MELPLSFLYLSHTTNELCPGTEKPTIFFIYNLIFSVWTTNSGSRVVEKIMGFIGAHM